MRYEEIYELAQTVESLLNELEIRHPYQTHIQRIALMQIARRLEADADVSNLALGDKLAQSLTALMKLQGPRPLGPPDRSNPAVFNVDWL